MIRALWVCVAAAVVLVVWVLVGPTPSLDGTVLPPVLLLAAVVLVLAAIVERRVRR